ncbi:sodium-dependent transporter [Fulvivirgaceae bacterium BMA10]|uniref:Sodium-dependent transporter n=1 Tax=Splendidivirga corallicola TaxID=3051826 RepID=A0ABT8KIQ1_9BACT|nr:sodium-dependent transporter [Fulvivirgaceae bacterium BMA10]
MASNRGEFSSSLGFIMAAAGSAIGLGNIWGFPTQTAQNGGAAFVLMYLILAFLVGYPLLMAEFVIGRHTRSNPVGAYQKMKGGKNFVPAGFIGILTSSLILSFYSIIAGTMMAHFVEPIFRLLGANAIADWCISNDPIRNITFTTIFFLLTISIITGGVKSGIEKWSSRLMPALLVMLIMLTIYVLTLNGAGEGVKIYLLPDFKKAFTGELLLGALGQSFFSLSLGVGTMLVYGSYISNKENLPRLGILVTLADVGIAFLAGLMIIPAIYVAANAGTQIFDEGGNLISGPNLVFQVLPEVFKIMGGLGIPAAIIFFLLMSVAALTSSISMLEVPVAYMVDAGKASRKTATWVIGGIFWIVGLIIAFGGDAILNMVVSLTTQYSQPLLGLVICVFIGWVAHRNTIIEEIKKGSPDIENTFFMKTWPFFVKFISPLLILIVFLKQFF